MSDPFKPLIAAACTRPLTRDGICHLLQHAWQGTPPA